MGEKVWMKWFVPKKNEKAVSISMCNVLSTEDNTTGDEIEWSFS